MQAFIEILKIVWETISVFRERLKKCSTVYSTFFLLLWRKLSHLYRNENQGLHALKRESSQKIYNLNAKSRPTQLSGLGCAPLLESYVDRL